MLQYRAHLPNLVIASNLTGMFEKAAELNQSFQGKGVHHFDPEQKTSGVSTEAFCMVEWFQVGILGNVYVP
jgi:hypothetical protein